MEAPMISVDILLYILGGMIILLFVWIARLEIKLKRFLKGKDAKTLEDSFMFVKNSVEKQITINQEIAKEIDNLDARLAKSLRGFDTMRFNAFKGTSSGGNQSFALALLNEEGDGMILSSLYGRDRFSAFAKPIQKGTSEFELSEEEKQVLYKAKDNLSR
ncbi:MAG: DUF4446 family protein [Candidatus Pacebacteria bacterium]|nr:DUF4446 family protein [Candidatus Paceibacterota bacterium]